MTAHSYAAQHSHKHPQPMAASPFAHQAAQAARLSPGQGNTEAGGSGLSSGDMGSGTPLDSPLGSRSPMQRVRRMSPEVGGYSSGELLARLGNVSVAGPARQVLLPEDAAYSNFKSQARPVGCMLCHIQSRASLCEECASWAAVAAGVQAAWSSLLMLGVVARCSMGQCFLPSQRSKVARCCCLRTRPTPTSSPRRALLLWRVPAARCSLGQCSLPSQRSKLPEDAAYSNFKSQARP